MMSGFLLLSDVISTETLIIIAVFPLAESILMCDQDKTDAALYTLTK